MWKFIALLVISTLILAFKQSQRPHWSADGDPELAKLEDKSYLKKSPSVRLLIFFSLIISEIFNPHSLTLPHQLL